MRVTDVHLEPRDGASTAIRFRIDGALLDVAILPRDVIAHLENQFKVLGRIDPLSAAQPQSARWTASFDDRKFDVRLTALSALSGERLTLRLLDPLRFGTSADERLPLDPIRIEPLMRCLIQREGMLLVTGPTACGKTTTVYGLMRALAGQPRSILTIEDPPEIQIPRVAINWTISSTVRDGCSCTASRTSFTVSTFSTTVRFGSGAACSSSFGPAMSIKTSFVRPWTL